MKNAISWFEIPSSDLDRAQRFYENIFKVELFPLDVANIRMRMFPIEDPATGIVVQLFTLKGFTLLLPRKVY
jgi:predicted enzyme related to lactoylglutathione lyase